MTPNRRALGKLITRAKTETDAFLPVLAKLPKTMVSPQEAYCAYLLAAEGCTGKGVVAELGAFSGGTTAAFGQALRARGAGPHALEVYDFFQHNAASRRRLMQHPLYEPASFLRIWEANTEPYRDLIDVFVGDIRETAKQSDRPIELLYVDVVKHASVINPVMQSFMRRLMVDGILFHQDYYHWQSPWVVYATEKIRPHLVPLGSVSGHALVFRLAEPIPESLLSLDYVDGISWDEKLQLMDTAIARQSGFRAALLTVSKLNLGLEHEGFDFDLELERARPRMQQPRTMRYINALLRHRESIRKSGRATW